VSLTEKIRTKELSPTEVTEAVLARMDKLTIDPFASASDTLVSGTANTLQIFPAMSLRGGVSRRSNRSEFNTLRSSLLRFARNDPERNIQRISETRH
jgi:hypothetical protein